MITLQKNYHIIKQNNYYLVTCTYLKISFIQEFYELYSLAFVAPVSELSSWEVNNVNQQWVHRIGKRKKKTATCIIFLCWVLWNQQCNPVNSRKLKLSLQECFLHGMANKRAMIWLPHDFTCFCSLESTIHFHSCITSVKRIYVWNHEFFNCNYKDFGFSNFSWSMHALCGAGTRYLGTYALPRISHNSHLWPFFLIYLLLIQVYCVANTP